MPIIFKARTPEGYVLKILAELLQNNLKTACFEIDEKGIRLQQMDHHHTILIDLDLDRTNFSIYKYRKSEKLIIGINLSHFYKMLKSVKKKDSLKLFIDDDHPTDFGIQIIPNDTNRITTSFVKILNVQNLDTDLPMGYEKPVLVSSSEFQKMCKGLTHISPKTHISSKGFRISFASDADGVMKRSTDFGETEDSDDEDDSKSHDEIEYSEEFETEQLTRITKLAGLSKNMQIYPKRDNPLLFRAQIGTLGKISIYIKSKGLQEAESRSIENGDV